MLCIFRSLLIYTPSCIEPGKVLAGTPILRVSVSGQCLHHQRKGGGVVGAHITDSKPGTSGGTNIGGSFSTSVNREFSRT
jgi:hypothetical protein